MTDSAMTELVVTPEWLAGQLGRPDVRVVDVSVITTPPAAQGLPWGALPARAEYLEAHIPGAAFVDLVTELSDAAAPFPYTLPAAGQVDGVFRRLGVDEGTHVVLYDGQASSFACRAWLVLRHFGLDAVSVLDGGIGAWTAAGLPVESGESPAFPAGSARARGREGVVCGTADVVRIVEEGGGQLVNVLARSQWDGSGVSSYARVGQIPGSIEAVAARLVDPASGAFVPLADAARLFEEAEIDLARPIVTYCGGGVSAAKAALALARLGAQAVAVYDGSLSEWTADPELPLEGAPTGGGTR
ncbi:MAG: sulfurtransferase [Actinobacteria bacterium]|nr:sulfurtransferase [Actinomycetota bacterium]